MKENHAMTDRNRERDKIILDLTELANSLVIGGLRKAQPDLLILGKIMLTAIGAVDSPTGVQTLEAIIQEFRSRSQQSDEVRDLLSDLGIRIQE
jgi:hypothetical protein